VDASLLLASGGGGDVESVCYLCLDVGEESSRRDCACRGTDAGFVHLSCLVGFAETKSIQASEKMFEFRKPWAFCPGCHQEYQNELAVDIASKFVSFVRRQYPRDTQRQVESLNLKLAALDSMFDVLQPRQKREYGVTATVMQSLIGRMKGDAPPLPRRYSHLEAFAYSVHGRIALDEGTEESALHFENQLKVNEAVGDDEGIAMAQANIAIAKSEFEDGDSEELLKVSRDVYEVRIAELG